MQKRLLIVAASIVLLAAGCGNSVTTQQSVKSSETSQVAAQTQGQGTFKALLAMGKSLKCESSFESQGSTSKGTMYIANGKMRGDFDSQVQGKAMQMHMLVKDETSYTWIESGGAEMGYKMALTNNTAATTTTQSKTINTNQQVSYNCQPWSEDDSQFNLPANVTFADQAEMMQSLTLPKGAAQGMQNATACAACNSAGSGKAQCLVALGCK